MGANSRWPRREWALCNGILGMSGRSNLPPECGSKFRYLENKFRGKSLRHSHAPLAVGRPRFGSLRPWPAAWLTLLRAIASVLTVIGRARCRPGVGSSRSARCRPPVHRPALADNRSSLLQALSRRCGRPPIDTTTARARRTPRRAPANSRTMTPNEHSGRCGRTKPSARRREPLPADAGIRAAKEQCRA